MRLKRRRTVLLAVLLGGAPLATVFTCDRTGDTGGFDLFSTNDEFLADATDFVFGDDDDDDD